MTTRLVVVLRDAANLGSQDAQPCGAPAHVRAVTAFVLTATEGEPPRWRTFGSTRPTGMQPRPAGPACGRYATSSRLCTWGRLESLNRAFSGGCEYPV